jgi:hypothetical protein
LSTACYIYSKVFQQLKTFVGKCFDNKISRTSKISLNLFLLSNTIL